MPHPYSTILVDADPPSTTRHSTFNNNLLLAGVALVSFTASLALGTVLGEAVKSTALFAPSPFTSSSVTARDVSLAGGVNHRITPTERRERRKRGIRKKIEGTEERPRLSVFRSNNHIYGQVINDETQNTLAAAGTVEKELREKLTGKTPIEKAEEVGRLVGQRAKEAGVEKVVFDRNGYKYHGRVKGVADGAREAGLDF